MSNGHPHFAGRLLFPKSFETSNMSGIIEEAPDDTNIDETSGAKKDVEGMK